MGVYYNELDSLSNTYGVFDKIKFNQYDVIIKNECGVKYIGI